MDYFFIYGPQFSEIIDSYTALTGRPRLPQLSMFGLQLSDKGSPQHDGYKWWQKKITSHRKAGFPFDHIVNDNRWRAGSGAWADSWFEWDSIRCPNPEVYNEWCKKNGVTMTLDLNRNNAAASEGWKKEYNLPNAEKYAGYGNSAPDYSNPKTRDWVWRLFWNQSFNPELNYPGDALWIDETDDLYKIPDSTICADGRSWAENENYYPFLIAKAVVQEGWDNENNNKPDGIGEAKRPFVWVRSMSAGAQRYAGYWSGDIHSNIADMKYTVRAMQVSGLGGFPYFNHDAGGFRWPGPDDNLYIQWAMALGSFTPIWRPHGIGENKRWPLDRDERCQDAALEYGKMRYEMMPYLYTYAHRAHDTGMPMARAMVIDNQDKEEAWKYDLQYMWGDEMLIAPAFAKCDTAINVWLPGGQRWYDFWTEEIIGGGKVIEHKTSVSKLPIFVKEGSIIPRYNYAKSTFFIDKSVLKLDVYTGKDGSFELIEDDGVTEKFRTKNEKGVTKIEFKSKSNTVVVYPTQGSYINSPNKRFYTIVLHGVNSFKDVRINGEKIKYLGALNRLEDIVNGYYYTKDHSILTIFTKSYSVSEKVEVNIF
jgi:alpha-D-xyloside xylohydrolase